MNDAEREKAAIHECKERAKWYTKQKNFALVPYWILQTAIVVLTAITPVLILVGGVSRWVQALPAAVAAIAAGLIGIFQMRETAGAFEVTATRLKTELFLFQTRSGVYAKDDPIGRFIETVAGIETETTADWQKRLELALESRRE